MVELVEDEVMRLSEKIETYEAVLDELWEIADYIHKHNFDGYGVNAYSQEILTKIEAVHHPKLIVSTNSETLPTRSPNGGQDLKTYNLGRGYKGVIGISPNLRGHEVWFEGVLIALVTPQTMTLAVVPGLLKHNTRTQRAFNKTLEIFRYNGQVCINPGCMWYRWDTTGLYWLDRAIVIDITGKVLNPVRKT